MESKKGHYILSKTLEYEEELEKIGEEMMKNPYERKFGKFEIEEIAGAFIQEPHFLIEETSEDETKEIKSDYSTKRALVALTREKISEITGCDLSGVKKFLDLMQEDGLVAEASEDEVLEDKLEEEVLRPTKKMLKALKGEKITHPKIRYYLLSRIGFPT